MMPRRLPLAFLLLLAATPLFAQRGDKRGEVQKPVPAHIEIPPAPIRAPEDEAATFKLAPGYHAERVAADPLIGDPVAMQFGPDGKLWVVEMRGYMPNPEGIGENEPVGIIAVLADTDADGRYDRRSVFAEGLVMPRALSLVDDGLLVAEPPHLWFFRDTNGDGAADEKTEIANDYGSTKNPEHTANGLLWAMDNWIYSANHTVRFRYLGEGRFARDETITRGQWGITQDDYGRLFYNSNSDPLRHDAIPSAYLQRNTGFKAEGTHVQVVPSRLPVWPSRVTTGVNRGYKILNEEGKITSMTAASGPVVYRGTLYPPGVYGDAFVPEPSGNLIKRIMLREENGVVAGVNAYEGAEFMTSTDERFRPVNLYNGPDGALYVVDFYRGIIQHRIYMTTFLRQQVEARDLDQGRAKGRIWRIVPDGAPRAKFDPGLAVASTSELIARLDDGNGWVRDTAQRLLVEQQDIAAVPGLRAAALDRGLSALARLHALWTLEGLGAGALDRETLLAAFGDGDGHVAAAAVRLAEPYLKDGDKELGARIASLVETRAEPEVRLQLALTLGEAGTPAADAALRRLVIAAGRQPFLAGAVVSGLAGREVSFIEGLIGQPAAAANATDAIRFATSAVLKSGAAARIERVLAFSAAPGTPQWARAAMLDGVRHFLPRSPDKRTLPGKLPAEPTPLVSLAARGDAPSQEAARELLELLEWPGKPGQDVKTARPLTAAEQALFELGKAQWAVVCAACHQPNGEGLAGLAPPLVNSKWALGDDRILARIVLNGKANENLIMPAWKSALTDETIAALLTFIRRSWGHEADPVSPATVSAARQAVANREEPFNEEDLEALARTLRPRRK